MFLSYAVNAQSVKREYAIAGSDFYRTNLSDVKGIRYAGAFSSDSVYVEISGLDQTERQKFSKVFFSIRPSQKISMLWKTVDSVQTITISCFDISGLMSLKKMFESKALEGDILYERIPFLSLKVKVKNEVLNTLLGNEEVKFVSFEHPMVREINFVERTNHRVSQFAPNFPMSSYLTGKGITMAEWDGGDVGKHIDFDGRLTLVKGLGINSHATHVAGTMAGAGNLDPLARGMAPEAKIYSWDFNGDIVVEMDTNKKKLGYVLTQNSYGYWTGYCADFAQYDATSTDMDHLSIKYPDLLHVFAAGNSRSANCVSGGYKTILSGFQSAKNTISVAAVSSVDGDSYFSCAGPTQDGRFKPEISAVGVNVYSTQNNNTYAGGWNGTSMATPGASGSIALLYERFKNKYGYIPQNYLAKNIVSNTTDDIGNAGPDYYFGFGRINGQAAVNLIDSGFWNIDSVAQNATYLDTFYIPSGLNQVKVMLTWNDIEVPATNAGPVLVNDLDLTVTDSSGTTYNAWWCNPGNPSALAVRKRDSINNIEQVTIKNPPGGRIIIKVKGYKVPNGKQTFAVTFVKESRGLTVVYPNGNETMESPSNAAKAQMIRWDNRGVSGNYTLEFSRDNGTSWQTIASNIPNAQNYCAWQTLADTVSTSKALIRISTGSIKDVSDNTFNIAGLVSGITTLVCDSQVFLRWKTVPATAFYRVYLLENGKMVEKGTPRDTSFVIKGLQNGKPYWFAVSRKGTNGAESQRSGAVSAVPNGPNMPPRITLQPKDTFTCFNNLYFAKSKATGTGPVTAKWEFSNNNGISWNAIPSLNDSINMKSYTPDFTFLVRRTYTNLCLAPVVSRSASFRLDSFLDIRFLNRDSIVCKNSVIRDSVIVKSKIPSVITWYNDSLAFTKLISKGFSASVNNTLNRPVSVWAEIANYCGVVKSKDLSKPSGLNGRNDYTLFPKPQITISDTIMACVGETILLNPALSGGRPGFRQLIIKTEDSSYLQYSLSMKIKKNQWVRLYCFDHCYPDTIVKDVFIQMRSPLSISVNNDSTICYNNKVTLKAIAAGGNGNYVYTWKDIGAGPKTRTVTLGLTAFFKVTLSDNCTEQSVSDSVSITVLPPLDFTLSASKDTMCSGNILNLKLVPSGGRVGTRITTWKDNTLTGNTPNLIPKKSQWYPVTLSDGCSPSKTDSVFVFVREPLKIDINAMDTVCNGRSVKLSAIAGGGLSSRRIDWMPMAVSGQTISYTPLISQNIIAVVKDFCTFPDARDTIWLNVYDALKLEMIKDTSTCFGKALTLQLKSTGGKSGTQRHYWDNVRSVLIAADSFITRTYTYAVADDCKDSIAKFVKVTVSPKLSISPALIKKCSYSDLPVSFTVNTGRTSQILWDKWPAGKNQVVKDQKSTTYRATLSDGCSDTSMVNVPVMISDFSANALGNISVVTKTASVTLNVLPFKTYINWHDGAVTPEVGTKANHTYNDYGQYKICRILEDDIACTDTVCKPYDNSDPAGFSKYKISIYPNPVQDLLKFTFNQLSKDLSLQIIDASGKIVYTETEVYPAYSTYTINLKGIAAGVYTLKIISNGEAFIQKFVKQ